MKLPFYPELVKAFYSNLEIQEDSLISEVYGIKMVIDQSLFFELTQLSSDGVPFEGTLDDEWNFVSTKRILPKGFLPDHWHSNAASCTT